MHQTKIVEAFMHFQVNVTHNSFLELINMLYICLNNKPSIIKVDNNKKNQMEKILKPLDPKRRQV
jgi:hypothetical protein